MISFNGLATGLDTSTLISKLVEAESAPIERLTAKQALIDSKSKKLTSLKSKLDDLRNAALALDTRKEALPVGLSSSNTSRVRGTVTGGVSPTRFDLEVVSLAKGARMYSNGVASDTTAGLFGTGQLEITTSAGTSTLAIDGSDTLDSVRRKIDDLDLPVTTNILHDGTGFRLQVVGEGVGAANAVSITETGTTLGFGANIVSSASDASFVLDGIPMTRGSNSVENAFPGVTLELLSASPTGEKTSIEVTNDPAALETAVRKVVDAYNAVNTFLQAESAWTGTKKAADSLSGDSTLRSIQSRLRSTLMAPVAGATGPLTSLGPLGVSLGRDGSLSLDATKLKSALATDPDAVAKVLGSEGTGAMALLAQQADYFADGTDGVLSQRLTSMKNERRGLDDRIERMQTRLDKYESQLTQQYAKLEQLVSSLQSQGSQLTAAMSGLNS